MRARIFFWSITSALAGFLFGFDTVVISGAEQTIQSLWHLSPGIHGIAMASALYGTVLGALLGGWPADRFGRRATLLWVGVLYVISAVGCGFANGIEMFIAARFIGGIGIGISTVAAPLYISEISPPAYRGRLAGMFQFNIVFGILVAFASNALLAGIGENAWRWMLGVAACPSLLYTLLCFGIPESPRWLIGRKGDRAAGLKVLKLIEPDATSAQIEAQADGILAASSERVLSLAHDDTLRIEPAPELEALRCNPRQREYLTVSGELPVEDVRGECLEISAVIDPGDAKQFGLKVRCSPEGGEQTVILYSPLEKTLKVELANGSLTRRQLKEQVAPFELKPGEPLRLRVFLDRSVVEVYANGRQCITQRIYPSRADSLGVALVARGGSVKVPLVDAWDMSPGSSW